MKSPEEYHWTKHLSDGPFEECWSCGRAKAKCKRKVRFSNSWSAWGRAHELNQESNHQICLKAYQCRWCLSWHLTSKTDTFRDTRDRREMRAWQVERELRRRGEAQDL